MRDFLVWKKKHTKIYWIIETTKKTEKRKKKRGFLNIKCENTQMLIISFTYQEIKKIKNRQKIAKNR